MVCFFVCFFVVVFLFFVECLYYVRGRDFFFFHLCVFVLFILCFWVCFFLNVFLFVLFAFCFSGCVGFFGGFVLFLWFYFVFVFLSWE